MDDGTGERAGMIATNRPVVTLFQKPKNRGQTTFKRLGLPELRLLKKTVVCPRLHPFTLWKRRELYGDCGGGKMLFKEEKGDDLNGDSFYPAYTPLIPS